MRNSEYCKKYLRQLLSHQGFKRYFSNTLWLFGEQFLRIVAGLFVGVWVARYLGPEQFGVFSYALAFVAIFGGIAKLGLDGILVRDLVNEPEKREIYLGTAFWLKLVGAFSTLGLISFFILFTSNTQKTNIYIFIIASGLIFQSYEVVDFYFRSQVLSKFVSISKLVQLFFSSILKIYLVITASDLIWFVIVSLIDQATLAVTLYFVYRLKRYPSFYRQFDMNLAKKLIKGGCPLILSSLALMVQARIDQVMIKEILGNVELGYYSAAMRLIEVFGFIPTILVSSLFPAIINAKKISINLFEERLSNLYRLMMCLFILVALPIYLIGSEIVVFLYKDAYAPAGALFSLMAIRLFFTNYGVARGAFLMAENLMTYSLLTLLLGALLNLVLNYFLIREYGAVGAIWSAIASFLVTTFVIDFLYSKTRRNLYLMVKSMMLLNFRSAK